MEEINNKDALNSNELNTELLLSLAEGLRKQNVANLIKKSLEGHPLTADQQKEIHDYVDSIRNTPGQIDIEIKKLCENLLETNARNIYRQVNAGKPITKEQQDILKEFAEKEKEKAVELDLDGQRTGNGTWLETDRKARREYCWKKHLSGRSAMSISREINVNFKTVLDDLKYMRRQIGKELHPDGSLKKIEEATVELSSAVEHAYEQMHKESGKLKNEWFHTWMDAKKELLKFQKETGQITEVPHRVEIGNQQSNNPNQKLLDHVAKIYGEAEPENNPPANGSKKSATGSP